MLRNCDTSHYMENKGRMVRLAEYSRDCLKALRAETNIQYEGRQGWDAATVPYRTTV